MPKLNKNLLPKIFPPIFLWCLVALYTFLLPDAIILYRYITENFGNGVAGKVPVYLVTIFGIAYICYLLLSKKNLKNLLFIIPCAVIVLIIFYYESNPNKHIHIPEYAILAWLVYAALSRNYQGKGIYFLIFICTSLLGIVDELEQGIHPTRFYGFSDMMVNSSSALIGVFTIMGLSRFKESDRDWTRNIKEFMGLLGFILFGFVDAVLMVSNLFQVQAQGGILEGVYPVCLLAGNIIFLINAPLVIYLYRPLFRKCNQNLNQKENSVGNADLATIQLWIFPLLTILFYIHILVVYANIVGINFR
jgi:hypothetical protein